MKVGKMWPKKSNQFGMHGYLDQGARSPCLDAVLVRYVL